MVEEKKFEGSYFFHVPVHEDRDFLLGRYIDQIVHDTDQLKRLYLRVIDMFLLASII